MYATTFTFLCHVFAGAIGGCLGVLIGQETWLKIEKRRINKEREKEL